MADPGQQQQFFMNPQTENLTHMYSLVDTLLNQLVKNKAEKEELLRSVDVLSNRITSGTEPKVIEMQQDIVLFTNFLERRISSESKIILNGEDKEIIKNDKELYILRQQNSQLQKLLRDSNDSTMNTLDLLKFHEESFIEVVSLLRQDILNNHIKMISIIRKRLENKYEPLRDKEFEKYLKEVKDIQKLMDISELYKDILRVLD
ncbi:hypothetical protein NCAS_0A08620 [Naumovozyma castellii]|uniref:Uncharacterized protein n=1 Tax=Naumovozyma castellii TaxID=27288 RepID=G0V7H2_NAUCA|nr:hypothetical protein NCAS_0A08620 [Naumovozyma castellii CBS 4309]CCC67420.1 hypothetical protein NCAS_0A08620 [Naumovozyma castellii CBS 4309]